MALINVNNDTSAEYKPALEAIIKKNKALKSPKVHELSPNSSKFSSVSFTLNGVAYDVVIAKGANKGESFEKNTVTDLQRHFSSKTNTTVKGDVYTDLIGTMMTLNKGFSKNEVKKVYQRSGSTKKEGVPIEKLGEVIGDIVLEETDGSKWYISLKDSNGDTFSSYSGASTLFDPTGAIVDKSPAAEFLRSFGVDLNQVQAGFDKRNRKRAVRPRLKVSRPDPMKMKAIFERAWGMNYFYVKRDKSKGFKVFWIDRKVLNNLAGSLGVVKIEYPNPNSKQIKVVVSNAYATYAIEFRNSKAGEYPNDVKFKILSWGRHP